MEKDFFGVIMKRIKHLFLSVMMLSSALLATGCQQGLPEDQIPDYSGYNHQFEYFGYHSAHDGWYTIDKVPYYTGESFLTTEQYQLYKDVGMTMFYPQSTFKIPDKILINIQCFCRSSCSIRMNQLNSLE